ncbi:MCE family protein [Nocardia caishijiensis]|uniref:Phospholipid/cholesterol/gamma-HCH transport system substrate-binding protein n=1 Tax=Nocardia caishijiensis TaxID=184756 RepID=A0ABQ6YQ93_9NOCA|nr:MCE family protein [Nocardia caishijiensis]KAF0847944.1 phospholipid/cholesterol/gamma-HCH transport system substrate-binding protein [Nocardia caishijiensis]
MDTSRIVAALQGGLGRKLAALALVGLLVAGTSLAIALFQGAFTNTAVVLVNAPRTGLVLDPDAKVKVRGVEIGRVTDIDLRDDGARLRLEVDPDQLKLVPANAGVDIRSTTVFGAKYVNFVVPEQPSSTALAAGSTVEVSAVTVEFNTLFQHLSDVLAQVEPEKLNATLTALGTALEGRGDKFGDLLVRSDRYLREMNPYLPTLQSDLDKTAQVTDLYSEVTDPLLRTVDNATVTSQTIAEMPGQLDNVLVNVIGLSDTVGAVLRENEHDLVTALDLLRPTTAVLYDYRAAVGCVVNGLGPLMPIAEEMMGGLLPGVGMNASFMLGAEPYSYPNDLPKVNATGGPRCEGVVDRVPESHSDYLVTDTSEGAPYTPSTEHQFNGLPRVFQLMFDGMPGVTR